MTDDAKKLREYLGMVLDVEGSLYTESKLLKSLENKLTETLDKLRQLETPKLPPSPDGPPEKPQEPREPTPMKRSPAGPVLVVFGIALLCCANGFSFGWPAHPICTVLSVIAIVVGAFLNSRSGSVKRINRSLADSYEKEKAEYPQKLADYKKALADYENAMAKYESDTSAAQQENVRAVLAAQSERAVLEANIAAVEKQRDETRSRLETLYSVNIIHPKYRGLVPVGSLYEYIDTGRCETLEGAQGAYNIYENEVRLDRITTRMDVIAAKLDAIQGTQYMIYNAVVEGNRRTAELLESVSADMRLAAETSRETAQRLGSLEDSAKTLAAAGKGIAENSKIAAYNAERSAKELEYFNRMRYQLGDYDKVWDNERP